MHKIIDIIFNIIYSIRAMTAISPYRRFVYRKKTTDGINILCTGPSLKTNVSVLVNDNQTDTFALNDFGVSDYFEIIKPKYYVLVDPAYWESSEKCNKEDVRLRELLYHKFNEIKWDMTLFIPWEINNQGVIHKYVVTNRISIKPFNYTSFRPTKTKFYKNILRYNFGVVPVGNVLGCALYLSINMGYKNINIYGAEHSWTMDLRVNELNQVCTIKRHFYEEDSIMVPWRKSNTDIFRMSEILYSLRRHFLGYEYLEWYSKQMDAHIFNCTKGSFIDSFERR